jgi:membrane glycosyltransferase
MDLRRSMKSRQGMIALDLLITLVVFVAMIFVLRSHVPSETPAIVLAVSAFTSACLTALFWLAMQMFKAVFSHQREKTDEDET